jgi:hypothetical protein
VPTKRYRAGNLARLIGRLGVQGVARGLGVSPSTVYRWRRSGRGIPEHRWPAAESLEYDPATGKRLPTLRALEARYLRLTADALASLFGVAKRTAQGWKRKKALPKRHLVAIPEPVAKPRTHKGLRIPRPDKWSGYITEGITYKLRIDRELTPDLVVEIVDWLYRLPKWPEAVRYQGVAKADILYSDGDPNSPPEYGYKGVIFNFKAGDVPPVGSTMVENTVIPSGAWSDPDNAIRDLQGRLLEAVQYGLHIKTVGFKAYRPIKGKEDRMK